MKKALEYTYEYDSSSPPFYAFEKDGSYYALFSEDYQQTKIMTLPEGKVICEEKNGEKNSYYGFCPVEFWVPDRKYFEECMADQYNYCQISDIDKVASKIAYKQGCVWGDDTSWKLQAIDLDKSFESGSIVVLDECKYLPLQCGKLPELIDYMFFDDNPEAPNYTIRVKTLEKNISVKSVFSEVSKNDKIT